MDGGDDIVGDDSTYVSKIGGYVANNWANNKLHTSLQVVSIILLLVVFTMAMFGSKPSWTLTILTLLVTSAYVGSEVKHYLDNRQNVQV